MQYFSQDQLDPYEYRTFKLDSFGGDLKDHNSLVLLIRLDFAKLHLIRYYYNIFVVNAF